MKIKFLILIFACILFFPILNNTTGCIGDKGFHAKDKDSIFPADRSIDDQENVNFISSTNPADGATDVGIGTKIVITFLDEIDENTITNDIFVLSNIHEEINGEIAYNQEEKIATFVPNKMLSLGTVYTGVVSKQIKNIIGMSMSQDYEFSFTTKQGEWRDPILARTSGSSNVSNPNVDINKNGNAFITWMQEERLGEITSIYARRYFSESGWENTSKPVEQSSSSAKSPDVAINDNGDAVVVWLQSLGTVDKVYANLFKADSSWLPNRSKIIGQGLHDSETPKIVMDDMGNSYVAWKQRLDLMTGTDIMVNFLESNVNNWSSLNAVIVSENIGNVGLPNISANSERLAAVVWEEETGFFQLDVKANNLLGDLDMWNMENQVSLETREGISHYPQIAMDIEGNIVIVWYQSLEDSWGIFTNNFINGEWGEAGQINTGDTNILEPFVLDIDMNDYGEAVVVWGDIDGLIAQRYNMTDGWLEDNFQIDHGTVDNPSHPSVGIDDNGNIIVAWIEDGNVWVRHFHIQDGVWDTDMPLTDSGDITDVKIAVSENGTAIIVWISDEEIYASIYK